MIPIDDFNLEATLESGQVFGFVKDSENGFLGFIEGEPVRLYQKGEYLQVDCLRASVSERSIRHYFDLDRNLNSIYELLALDRHFDCVREQFRGLRVIRQDPWEALACFIVSANNNIKRIQKIRRNLSLTFSDSEFQFPKANSIAKTSEEVLRNLGLGYRAPFLLETARRISDEPEWSRRIHEYGYETAKENLLAYPGVGEKVADCALLFGFQKYEAFPADVWILRAMKKLYFKKRNVSERKIRLFARKKWGSAAGYIQQYLYYGVRQGIV